MNKSKTDQAFSFPHKIESAGVDWITASAPRAREFEPLYARAQELVIAEADAGNDVSVWKWQGYQGIKAGGASVGRRRDGVICQLRSETAREHWQSIMPHAANVSRVDLQLTARLEEAHTELIRSQYARLRRAKRLRGRPLDATLIDSQTRGSSLYLGRRISDKFARMYDKGSEEHSSEPGTLIRWEVEYKKKTALQIALGLNQSESVDHLAASTVSEHFRSRRIQCAGLASQGLEIPRAPTTSNNETRMAYLRSAIAPMLDNLLKRYTLAQILEALCLDDESIKNRYDDFKGGR